jgi:uncharacterized HAD superfamily protein
MIQYNYLIDIDGTITEDIPNEEVSRMPHVAPYEGSVERINQLYEEGHTITFFTSRTSDMRDLTEAWLNQHGFRYHGLIMDKPRGGKYVWIDNHEVIGIQFPSQFEWEREHCREAITQPTLWEKLCSWWTG